MLRRNVLIFHQAALGDFIVTWPLAMTASRIFPQSRIIYVTHSQKGALAERVLGLESADAEAGWHTLYSDSPQLPERPAKLLEGAHTVISFTAGNSDQLAQGVARIAGHAKVVSLDTKKPGSGHVTATLLDQLQPHAAMAGGMEQMLRSVQARGVGFALNPADRVVIHPGAGKDAHRWPAQRFLRLARMLIDAGRRVRVLLGEAEIERCAPGMIAEFENLADVRRPQTLLELLAELAAANVFIGNDSGPGHLAGIIGVATISLFGGSDPGRWHPLGPRVNVIGAESLETIDPQNVYDLAAKLLGD